MGCCFGKRRSSSETTEVELSTTTNAAVTARPGAQGEKVKVASSETSFVVSGEGSALASCPLDCDVCCWEVRVGAGAAGVRVGVTRFNEKKPRSLAAQLKDGGAEEESWVFPGFVDGGKDLEEGDVVTIFWDQTDLPMLSFSVNNTPYPEASVSRIRPSNNIYPAVSVAKGSVCDYVFDSTHWKYQPASSKWKAIICATSLI